MNNPILQALNVAKNLNSAAAMFQNLKNGNPDALFNTMYNSNPEFRRFVDANKGKSPEQIAQENGVDLGQLQNFMK